MAGTIPLSMTQQFDEFSKVLAGGLLYIIQAGTVNTPQQPYQDFGLSVLQPNPIPLDAAGRIPPFYLADGFIKFRLVNKFGVTQYERDNVLVIGPSSGSGGGGGVDPTTLIQTGMMQCYYGTGVLAGFVRANARTIGNALSGASERANADTQALWIFLYNADPNLTVSGGRSGNALNDFNANKQLTLPDYRGRVIAGLDDMGNAAAGRLTNNANGFGVAGTTLGAEGGAEGLSLSLAQIPTGITSNGNNSITVSSGNAGGNGVALRNAPSNPVQNVGGGVAYDLFGNSPVLSNVISTNPSQAIAVTSNNTGGGQHRTMQPTKLATIYLKL